MNKKIYLATPVNARKEATLVKKLAEAHKRIQYMRIYLSNWYPEAEFLSVFTIDTVEGLVMLAEPLIMGQCVEMVMCSDIIILDDGWEDSNGCNVERYVADRYGKQVYTMQRFRLKEKLKEKTI